MRYHTKTRKHEGKIKKRNYSGLCRHDGAWSYHSASNWRSKLHLASFHRCAFEGTTERAPPFAVRGQGNLHIGNATLKRFGHLNSYKKSFNSIVKCTSYISSNLEMLPFIKLRVFVPSCENIPGINPEKTLKWSQESLRKPTLAAGIFGLLNLLMLSAAPRPFKSIYWIIERLIKDAFS